MIGDTSMVSTDYGGRRRERKPYGEKIMSPTFGINRHRKRALGFLIASAFLASAGVGAAQDNEELAALYRADQAARSDKARAAGEFPTLQEERNRRIAVMRLVANGSVKTARDHVRAAVILQHTPTIVYGDDVKLSQSAENRILAFFLARRAHQMGDESGAHFMAWTYNYWIRSCGLEIDRHGFELRESGIVPLDQSADPGIAVAKCGFDPRPYFDEVNAESPAAGP